MANPKTLYDLQLEYYAILKSLATNSGDMDIYDVHVSGFGAAATRLAELNKQAEDLGIPFKGVIEPARATDRLEDDTIESSSSSDDSSY